ncbi:hypothetical protein H634G_07047 [Metarhizium anisopliae BRIP 53293]|uniref:Uncharacterized protein n=1 Tax=Metarhizium anisopliae BRIP 53293 TaxID=1291518 RepID=A0A0D9NU60_METAN|nr:hypothetical protein H634G_07047 [Metarhizium anisopliae BRIP 53293]KJK94771.1 hypothetical protein H633G_01373 [Metarhizium anisopliae BRIP 53284]
MFSKATLIVAIAGVLTLTTALEPQQPLNAINRKENAVHGNSEAADDSPAPALEAERVEFLGYVNASQVLVADCPQWPTHNQAIKVGEVWWQDNGWYAQTLKMWNHRHAFEWGYCVETRFGWDSDSGQTFYAQKVSDSAQFSEWALKAYKIWSAALTEGVVGWNADKARWIPCTNVPGCGGGARFAMDKNLCFLARLKSGRVITACETFTNQGYRLCGEYSRKHHGRNRCGTGRNSHYWFGTETGCWEN